MKIEFIKCHGSGNDFVMVDCFIGGDGSNGCGLNRGIAELGDTDLQAFTRSICDRKGPVGADGTLFLLPSQTADARMRMFNPDGSEAEMCGNGIRCAARLAVEIIGRGSACSAASPAMCSPVKTWPEDSSAGIEIAEQNTAGGMGATVQANGILTAVSTVRVETMKGILECRREDDIFPGVDSFSVLIDNVSLTSDAFACAEHKPFINSVIPALSKTAAFTFVSLGNLHIVSYRENEVEENGIGVNGTAGCNKAGTKREIDGETRKYGNMDEALLMQTGIEANRLTELFPEGVNVTFYTSAGNQALYTETFERGAGLTQACGTAMSACSIAACIGGVCRAGEWINVYNKGGMVRCFVAETDIAGNRGSITVRLLGNATFEYSAVVDFDNGDRPKLGPISDKNCRSEEIRAYEQFRESIAGKS